jgi:hypothetical protein
MNLPQGVPDSVVAADTSGHDERLGLVVPEVVQVGVDEGALHTVAEVPSHAVLNTLKK